MSSDVRNRLNQQHLAQQCEKTLSALNTEYRYYSLPELEKHLGDISRLPKSMKVLLENLLRHLDGDSVAQDDLQAIANLIRFFAYA